LNVAGRLNLALLFSALLFAASAAQAAEPDLTARWLASCDPAEEHEYFAIRIFPDGHVQYLGGSEAKESGEKTLQIKVYDARYLVTRAADFMRAPPAGRTSSRPAACMEFQTRVDGQMRVRRESIETRASRVFANDIARKVPMLIWVCPARENPEDPKLSLVAFCKKWPDGTPLARGER
jgi:hypothetical protein